jgi:hypothetical protein
MSTSLTVLLSQPKHLAILRLGSGQVLSVSHFHSECLKLLLCASIFSLRQDQGTAFSHLIAIKFGIKEAL